jgi:PAS domain S-box-containing protein
VTRIASGILLLCVSGAIGFGADREQRPDSLASYLQTIKGGPALAEDLKFTHLTTNDGLSQSGVTEILQDRKGFMWFATRDGLNRYDGNTFVVYKNDPNDASSLSSNFILDLMEDEHGHLWIATDFGGVNDFDPATERFVRYRHDPHNPNSISGDSVETIARDSRGYLWFGTVDSGLDKFDPTTRAFTHYRNEEDGRFVGRITKVIAGREGVIWFVGERGLFNLNPETGRITRTLATITKDLAADYLYQDDAGNLWMLAWSPIVGLIKYDQRAERLTKYPFGAGATGVASSNLLADGQNGLWVASSQGLYYFDRRTERFTYRFQHNEANPNSLDDNTVAAIYRDRGGLLWVGTGSGLNLLDYRQEQFGVYQHLPGMPDALSAGKVTAIYEDSDNIVWVGFAPRALDRLDRKTGKLTHYVPDPANKNGLSPGLNVAGIYRDALGYLWLGGWGAGLDRLDERTGQFKHYRPNADEPNSLISDKVYQVYGDRSGYIWVGQLYGLSRLDPGTEQFTNYRPDPLNPAWNGSSVSGIGRDSSGMLWLGTTGGGLIRIDNNMQIVSKYPPDSSDRQKLNGGGITAIHEQQNGTLWVGAWDGVYRYNRQIGTFTRYTENQGLRSSGIMGILEDKAGRLWVSTKHGISRFDPGTETFRNYDVSDGLQGDEFSAGAYAQGPDGEMFFGGSNGFNAFFPENIRDDPYVPPVAITSFKIFNKAVRTGATVVLKKAIPYVDSLTLANGQNVFSFEFAALSYANSHKNRYQYKLDGLEPGWNEVGSKQRLATYTNLDPGKYVFRVRASNSDGVWNEEGVSLPILITPPWWRSNWFRAASAAVLLSLLWAAYQLRMRQVQRESRRLRDVIETIPAYVWSALPDGFVDFINRRWLEFSGFSLNQALGWGWADAVHPEDRARLVHAFRGSIAAGKAMEAEARMRSADGEYRWLLFRSVPLRDKAGKIVKWYGKGTDITELKRAEEERERMRQLEADLAHINRVSMMGELTASIAHEVNQPLTGIVSNGSACLRFLAGDAPDLEEIREAVHDIVRDGKRAGEVIARIRALTRRTAPAREKLDLNETVGEVLAMVGDEARKNSVVIRTQFADDLSAASGDRVQMQQVLLNLVINAIEAMSSVTDRVRQLVIFTENIDHGQVEVTVEDSGTGLDPSTMGRIFEPFYTMKSGGMGMGLSISRSNIESHGGRLWATANDGPGTSFHFTLPKYQGEEKNARLAAV